MTRGQREAHRRIFTLLPLLLMAAVALAFWQRHEAAEHLRARAARPALLQAQGGNTP